MPPVPAFTPPSVPDVAPQLLLLYDTPMEQNRLNQPNQKHSGTAALLCMLALMAFAYVLLHDLLGGTLLAHSAWDSYTLQAMAWRRGSLSLGQNYPWLELAVYEGEYFVSFPPFPSVVMLPFTFIFGENTPNNLIVAAVTMASAALAFRCLRRTGMQDAHCALGALFLTFGSNMMWMSTDGGVWFMAQAINMLLLLWALDAAMLGRRTLAYALIALAVGCRPFSALMFFPLFLCFYLEDRRQGVGFLKTAFKQWKAFLIPMAVAAAYMWYNAARFDSVLEFGHNYLPEFTESEHGQFHLSYILTNLKNLLLRPVALEKDLSLSYPFFDGFMFYVANPFFLVLFGAVIGDIRHKRMDALRLALLLSMAANLLLLCWHKTLGGWQFGARYTCDMLPAALAYFLLGKRTAFRRWECMAAAFGILFNVYGALAMTFLYG